MKIVRKSKANIRECFVAIARLMQQDGSNSSSFDPPNSRANVSENGAVLVGRQNETSYVLQYSDESESYSGEDENQKNSESISSD